MQAQPLTIDNGTAQAQSVYGGIGAFGLDLGYAQRIGEHWVARVQLNSGSGVSRTDHARLSGIDYDAKVRTGAGVAAFTDFYPVLDSGWRLTGGLVYARIQPELTGKAAASGSYQIGAHQYTASEVGTLKGRLRYNPVNLYLGGGWDSAPIGQRGWRFTSDLGLFTAGQPKVTLTATGGTGAPGLKADLDAERGQLSKWGVGAAVTLGAAYRF